MMFEERDSKICSGFDTDAAAAGPLSAVKFGPSCESYLEFPVAAADQLYLLPYSCILEILIVKIICQKV